MKDELSHPRPVCNAAKDEPCHKHAAAGEPLPGREFHIGRIER